MSKLMTEVLSMVFTSHRLIFTTIPLTGEWTKPFGTWMVNRLELWKIPPVRVTHSLQCMLWWVLGLVVIQAMSQELSNGPVVWQTTLRLHLQCISRTLWLLIIPPVLSILTVINRVLGNLLKQRMVKFTVGTIRPSKISPPWLAVVLLKRRSLRSLLVQVLAHLLPLRPSPLLHTPRPPLVLLAL